jgi:hypothetical protein
VITELGIELTVGGIVVLFVAGLYVTAWFEDRRKR